MWSGPRNLSTAMMYAFGNRVDTAIVDEPYYGAYLHHSGVEHPMNAEVLSSLSHEPEAISAYVTGPVPDGLKIWYQKQLAHHMLPQFSLDWVAQQENVFLIREPARVIASYERKRETLALEDLGFLQQKRIYDYCVALGQSPIVLDSDDILADPPAMLAALCAELGIAFDPAMLSWTAGPRAEDGVWAAHWYDAVHRSTGFGAAPGPVPTVGHEFVEILKQAQKIYQQFEVLKLGV